MTCHRCSRKATNAVAVSGFVLALCARHHRQVARALERDPRVQVGGRELRLDAPMAGGRR